MSAQFELAVKKVESDKMGLFVRYLTAQAAVHRVSWTLHIKIIF